MDIAATLDYLFSLTTKGIKPGLERVRTFLNELGNPQNAFRAVHVAGTNGKGSVSNLIYSVLRASGQKTGLYTSPHLLRFNERIVADGREIGDAEVTAFVDSHRASIEKLELTFFEITTALAFTHFKEQGVAWAVIETGLGGRLDATNVLVPAISVITDISIDHEQWLGRTVEEIAAEKAGIAKPGVPLVHGVEDEKARAVIVAKGSAVSEVADAMAEGTSEILEETAHDTTLKIKTGRLSLDNLFLPIPGRHQVKNALTALAALDRLGLDLTEDQVREGFKAAKIRGRLEFVKGQPALLYDVAHNPRKISALEDYLSRFFSRRHIVLVFGVMADKDAASMIRTLDKGRREWVLTRPALARAADPEALKGFVRKAETAPTVAQALEKARTMAGPRGLVVVTGSFYTVAEAMSPDTARRHI